MDLDIKLFNDYIDDVRDNALPNYIIGKLSEFGKEFIKARLNTTRTFTNRTTRLRNSIGYVVSRDGVVLDSDFESYSVDGVASAEGKSIGLAYATDLAKNLKGYALVCVAGAGYAFYVEAKGYDVITGSVLDLTQKLQKWSR